MKALATRDPAAAAQHVLDAYKRGELDAYKSSEFDAEFGLERPDKRARIAEACECFGLRLVTGTGVALCFAVYCVLRLLRPFVRIACAFLIFILSVGGAIAYFVNQATGVQALIMAGVVVACFAVRELYDVVAVWFGLHGHAAI